VIVDIQPEVFADSNGETNRAARHSFTVTGAIAKISKYDDGFNVDIVNMNEAGKINVNFRPAKGSTIDDSTILDEETEIMIITRDGEFELNGTPEWVEDNIYQYTIPEELVFSTRRCHH
jgi:hypothetical protein